MKAPITLDKLRNHLHYGWWKYALLIVAAVFGWNLIFTITAPRAPEEKKVIVGVYAYGSESYINAYMEQIRLELMPEMEEMESMYIMPDQTYGDMILTTRMAAQDCDIYLLPRTQFQNYAAQGGFMPLDEVLPELVAELEAAGISLSRGARTNDTTGEKHQYGIPLAELAAGTTLFQCDTSDMYLGVFFETGNDENVLLFFQQLVRDLLSASVSAE